MLIIVVEEIAIQETIDHLYKYTSQERMAFVASRITRRNPLPVRTEVGPLQVDTPQTRKWKKQREEDTRNGIKEGALRELLQSRAARGGVAKKGDIKVIVRKYNDGGYDFVTKGVLDYMIAKKKKCSLAATSNVPANIVIANDASLVSDVTQPTTFHDDLSIIDSATVTGDGEGDVATDEIYDSDVNTNVAGVGGRPKGGNKAEKDRISSAMKQAMTQAATLCLVEKRKAEGNNKLVPPGKYNEIIKLVEEEHNLSSGCISIGTVRSRLLRDNVTGYRQQNTSPLEDIEHAPVVPFETIRV